MGNTLANKLRQLRESILGVQLLEFSVVSVLLLTFIFGAFDINRALHSYTALQEGVRTSLRCVYTVNGECINVSQSSPAPLFDWYHVTSRDPDSEWVYQYDYEGREDYIRKPVYQIGNFTAEVLDSVSFNYQYTSHAFEQRMFPTQGDISQHIWMSRQPYISGQGGTPHQQRNNPRFSYRFGGGSYPQLAGVTTNVVNRTDQPNDFIEGVASSEKFIGRINFTLPVPVSDPSNCYQAQASQFDRPRNGGNAPLPSGATCGDNLLDQKMRVIIHVRGRNVGENSNTQAAVQLYLARPNGNEVGLGGVSFSGQGGTTNFCPRGSTEAYVDPDFADDSICDETLLHSAALEDLRMGETYGLVFKLRSINSDDGYLPTNGRARWNLSGVDFYGPTFESLTESEQCQEDLLPSQMAERHSLPPHLRTCTTVTNRAATNQDWYPGGSMNENSPSQRANFGSEYVWDNSSDIRAQVFGSQAIDYFYRSGSPRVEQASTEISCGANVGVADSSGKASIPYPSSASQVCPPTLPSPSSMGAPRPFNADAPVGFPILSSSIWSVDLNRAIPGTVDWERNSCQEQITDVALPQSITQYYHHSDGTVTTFRGFADDIFNETHVIHTGDTPPSEVLAQDERYSCGGFLGRTFAEGSRIFDARYEDSLFDGAHEDLGCSWEERLRHEAQSLGMSPAAYFTCARERGIKDFEISSPTDECSLHFDPGTPGSVIKIDGGPFPQGTTPHECQDPGASCYSSFAGFDGQPSDSEFEINTEAAAKDYGFSEIAAAYPAARYGCSGDDCVNLEVTSSVDTAGNATFGSQGSIEVPLNLLLGTRITLTYSERENWEGNYSR